MKKLTDFYKIIVISSVGGFILFVGLCILDYFDKLQPCNTDVFLGCGLSIDSVIYALLSIWLVHIIFMFILLGKYNIKKRIEIIILSTISIILLSVSLGSSLETGISNGLVLLSTPIMYAIFYWGLNNLAPRLEKKI